jgi:DNA-binding PucR family transcriptional regulator
VHVHPQTARYRLRRLRELLGEIDDPGARFELALALRAPGISGPGA